MWLWSDLMVRSVPTLIENLVANSDHTVLNGVGPARPRRNGSHSRADGRPQLRKTLPLKLSQPRSAACPWLRSDGTGQQPRGLPAGARLTAV